MDKVNLYILQNDKNKNGGNFYNVYVSENSEIKIPDNCDIETFESIAREMDKNIKKSGGIIVKKDQYIGGSNLYSNTTDEEKDYLKELIYYDYEIMKLYYKKDILLKQYLQEIMNIDNEIENLYNEKQEIIDNRIETVNKKQIR